MIPDMESEFTGTIRISFLEGVEGPTGMQTQLEALGGAMNYGNERSTCFALWIDANPRTWKLMTKRHGDGTLKASNAE